MSQLISITTQGLLFDMDGVLVSSIGSVERSWAKWAEIYGVNRGHTLKITHGRRAIDTVRAMRPDIDPLVGLKAIEDIEVGDVADTKLLPGVLALLNSLPDNRWTIVTSASTRLAKCRLGAAGVPVPKKMITADSVTVGKPDPEPYRKGAEILGFDAKDCVVVEDAPSGVGAGIAAGSKVLGVMGFYSAEALKDATWIVKSLESVKATMDGGRLRLDFEAE